MWQLFALGTLVFTAGESVVDKFALVAGAKVDSMVATFWRVGFFTLGTLAIGMVGWLGVVHLSFTPLAWLVALVCVPNSLFYTYLMRRIEVTGIGAAAYLAPFAFLFIDTNIVHTALSAQEVSGIILLVLGGLGFALDGATHWIKKELSPLVWGMLLFSVVFLGVESYAFKYAYMHTGINGVSFLASYGLIATAILFGVVIARGKLGSLFARPARTYIPRIAVSKGFDAVSSVFWTQALTLAAVSQLSAMNALEPMVLFIITVLAQTVFGLRVNERLGRKRLLWKSGAVSFLVLGGLLVG